MTATPTTAIVRRGRRLHPQRAQVQQKPWGKGFTLPEYLEAHQVQAVLAAAPNPRARLLMLLQWRVGLLVSEALAIEAVDLSLDSDQPTIRVRQGKGGRSRIVPVHPELLNALDAVLQFSQIGRGRIIPVSRSTARRWVQAALDRAVALGELPPGRKTGWYPHFPPLLRPPPAAAWGTDQLPVPVAWPPGQPNYIAVFGVDP